MYRLSVSWVALCSLLLASLGSLGPPGALMNLISGTLWVSLVVPVASLVAMAPLWVALGGFWIPLAPLWLVCGLLGVPWGVALGYLGEVFASLWRPSWFVKVTQA